MTSGPVRPVLITRFVISSFEPVRFSKTACQHGSSCVRLRASYDLSSVQAQKMSSTPRVLSEVGLVEQSPGAATVQSPSSSETAGPSNGGAPSTAAEKARAAVDEFLRVIDALPEADKLKTLRDRFLEMNVPERTDQEFLLSSAFRNVLKLAVIRCQERPSKAKVHIREVVNNMRLNSPKTPVSHKKRI